MLAIKDIICQDPVDFADYISDRLATGWPITPVLNKTDIDYRGVRISVRLTYHGFVVVVYDKDITKLIYPRVVDKEKPKGEMDRLISQYPYNGFSSGKDYSFSKVNNQKQFTTSISADFDNLMEYMEKALRYAESKPDKIFDYYKNGVKVSARYFHNSGGSGSKYFITFMGMDNSPDVVISVLEINHNLFPADGNCKQKSTAEKIADIINLYQSAQ